MQPDEAATTLDEIESLRRQTRRALRSFWFPLVVFGPLMLASGVLALVAEGVAIGIFWAVAAPAGTVAVWRHYRHRESSLGLSLPAMPYVVVTMAMVAGAFALPAATSGDVQEVVSVWAIAAGYAAFAALDREPWLGWLAAALALVPLVLLVTAPDLAAAGTGIVLGVCFLATGLVFRRRELAVR